MYVWGIRDPWKKAATELYLARYPGFVMRGDGRLDYGTRGRGGDGWGTFVEGGRGCGVKG